MQVMLSSILQASYAKEGDFTSSRKTKIAKADAALLEAHNLQTQFCRKQVGQRQNYSLVVHS